MEGVLVCALLSLNQVAGCDVTDANGRYALAGLAARTYVIGFDAGRPYGMQYYDQQASFSTAEPVSVTGGSTTAAIDAAFGPELRPTLPPRPVPGQVFPPISGPSAASTVGPPIPLIPTQGVLGTTVHVAPRPLVALGASHVSLSTRRSTLRVSCSGAPCRGSVELTTRVAIRSHAGTRSGRRFEQVVLARGTFALAAGRGASVVLHLTAAGRARATAARRHRLATDLVVSLAGGRTLTRTVLVR